MLLQIIVSFKVLVEKFIISRIKICQYPFRMSLFCRLALILWSLLLRHLPSPCQSMKKKSSNQHPVGWYIHIKCNQMTLCHLNMFFLTIILSRFLVSKTEFYTILENGVDAAELPVRPRKHKQRDLVLATQVGGHEPTAAQQTGSQGTAQPVHRRRRRFRGPHKVRTS